MHGGGSADHSDEKNPDNLLDTGTPTAWRLHHSAHVTERLDQLLRREAVFERVPGQQLRVLNVGCGHNARTNVPDVGAYVVGVDTSAEALRNAARTADEVHDASATELPFADASFDVVMFRFVLHHLIDQGPLDRAFAEARRVLKPGGRLVAVEPNLFHPIGLMLYCANRLRVSKPIMGTSDDWPLSPLAIRRALRGMAFAVRIHGVEYSWRRLPIGVQRFLFGLERLDSLPGFRSLGHTFLIVAHKD